MNNTLQFELESTSVWQLVVLVGGDLTDPHRLRYLRRKRHTQLGLF